MTTINSAEGATLFIGPAVSSTPATQAAYDALQYTQVLKVESLGEFGDMSNVVRFTALEEGRVEKSKGSRDAGTVAIVVGKVSSDPGQMAMVAASKTKYNYAVKIILDDAVTPNTGTGTAYYFIGLVMGARDNVGSVDNVVRTTFSTEINSGILEVEAT